MLHFRPVHHPLRRNDKSSTSSRSTARTVVLCGREAVNIVILSRRVQVNHNALFGEGVKGHWSGHRPCRVGLGVVKDLTEAESVVLASKQGRHVVVTALEGKGRFCWNGKFEGTHDSAWSEQCEPNSCQTRKSLLQ